uniref:[histone H3]-lysine(36) N-trimethyltransferase n=1 Tax=Salarias fasciatus TaxID=181472 RepID=A0A672JB44_SALFA
MVLLRNHREEGSGASVKVEGLSKAALIKSLSPRVMLSNHLLPKGTKMKVNLEDQGRQKVSFSFSQTKKPLQSPFFIPASPEKSVTEPHAALSQSPTPPVPTSITETPSQIPVSSASKLKTDLTKMHFKKQILSVSVTEEQASVTPEEQNTTEIQMPTSKSEAEFPTPQPPNAPSENAPIEAPEAKVTPCLKKPAASSGKAGESPSSSEQENKDSKRKTRSQSDSAPPGSESEGDSAQTSSSRKSVDSKSKTNSDSRSKDVKKSSSGSHLEEREKSYSKRSENHERSSSYSKSDRDSRYISSRSSRSDKDRRRSRSRSRSRSRGSRTSSSHSRSERSRGDRRSYYHDSDRRSHRSSPRRERRRSRSRTDRTRDSSDSEDDHRKTRTRTNDSSRSSNYSSSHKDSKSSSYSKSEKTSKSLDSSYSGEMDKRTQSSKSDRTSKRLDSDSQRKCSPDLDASYRKSSSHYKSETSTRSSSSSVHTHSQAYDKHQKSTSCDSDADHKGKSLPSEKNSSSVENCKTSQNKTSRPDSKQLTPLKPSEKATGHDRQSDEVFQSPGKAPSYATTTESYSQIEVEKSGPVEDGKEHGDQDPKEMSSCSNTSFQESSLTLEKESNLDVEIEKANASAVTSSESSKHANVAGESLSDMMDSLSSDPPPHVNLDTAVVNSCSSNDNIMCNEDMKVLDCSPGPKSSPDISDPHVKHDVQQTTEPEFVELNNLSPVIKQPDAIMSLKSDSSYLEAESQVAQGHQNMDTIKKSGCATRKSRWDIVGQDTSETDNSQKLFCAESKPTVRKVISVKKIEFAKDGQQDADFNNSVQQDAITHSTLVKYTESSNEGFGSDNISMASKCKDQSEPSQANTSNNHCDLKLTFPQQQNTDECPQINATPQSWNGDNYEDKSKEITHKNRLEKGTLLTQEALGGQSDANDSDNSEYDSDCGGAMKQLHSVVVVPNKSSLMVDTESKGASPYNHTNVSETHSSHTVIHGIIGNIGNTGLSDSSSNSVLCQSQSNMIDSTSHLEGSGSVIALPYVSGHANATGSTQTSDRPTQCAQGQPQHGAGSRGDQLYRHYHHGDLLSAGIVNDKNGFSLGWEFSQPEQPSSTYQQPDSSHGPQLANTQTIGSFSKEQAHQQSNALCPQQSPNMQVNRKPYLHAQEHSQDHLGEIHPDSLTNDDYSGYKPASLCKTQMECSGPNTTGSSSFVQGYEISSNSRGSTVPDPPRDDSFRSHRSRGPPKKRRPEIESDSDNEAEAGPALKKSRQGDTDSSKETVVKADPQRPLLTLRDFQDASKWKEYSKSKKMPPYFDLIEENLYLTERKKSKSHRDIKRMQCECPVLPREERSRGVLACGEDCLNRLLMIECSSRCLNGVYCSNRRFQMKQHADFEVILTEDKGWGLRAAKDLASNTFVLEYCGEVLDHKEFKTRVKEYARNKNIHYYFMSLKNNEIIDATLKGNCSRFMNHSCEPNCETQKWTVNGQLRVGFFTTKAVTAGTELTFDYQFQRYGKEAQKCFCGAPSCRGFLGGENRVSVRAAGGKMKKDRSRKSVDEELEALLENGEGLYDEKQVVSLCRLMVRVETTEQKLTCLKLIQDTQNSSCLKQFLDHHGLSLLWIFMAELSEAKGNSANNIKLQLEIMKTLAVLPICTKNMLEESRVLTLIQRWAQTKTLPQPAEMDGYSSENTSRAQTPLNTPDGSSTKLGPEMDGDPSKPAVFRRLKIISENSLDSALSDASKASDGKEEEEEEEDEEEEENSRAELSDAKQSKTETLSEAATLPSEVPAAPVDPSVIGTPSQDEEEGVSDVESERSQEPQLNVLDISGMAARLLESWKDLKEVYRIPKKSQVEKEATGKVLKLTFDPLLLIRLQQNCLLCQIATPRGVGKERNKLSTEERRKLFEQEVAQREAQKQQQQLQQQQQQQLQTMTYDPALAYASSPGFITYPPGYPIQTFVDPTNPNAGKVLLPTPPVDPGVGYEQTPQAGLISEMGLPSPSSTSQTTPVSSLAQHITTTTNLTTANPQQYAQAAVATQEAGVAVLSVPAQSATQVQGQQSYTTLWDPTTQQTVTVQTQPAQQYAAAPGQAQTQTAIYYQGQPCQTIYSIPTAYPQANTPVIQAYSEPTASYLHGQPVYPGHQQGVVVQQGGTVTTIVTSQTVQQEMIVPNNVIDLPPPSPPKPKTIVLPPNWKVARDPEGKIYYYHIVTRQTQWDPPTWEGSSDNTSVDHESEMDLGTPTYDENPSKFSTKTAEADTSSELAKKSKETFRKEMSQFIVTCLNPYRKPDCKSGRISNTEDFKHLARKLTHGVMNKELKACKNPEDLECNENVKHKTKEYIKKYMQRFGSVYRPKEDTEVY